MLRSVPAAILSMMLDVILTARDVVGSESLVRRNAVATVLTGVLAAIPSVMLIVIPAARDAVGLESLVRGNAVATMLRGVLVKFLSVMLVVITTAREAVRLESLVRRNAVVTVLRGVLEEILSVTLFDPGSKRCCWIGITGKEESCCYRVEKCAGSTSFYDVGCDPKAKDVVGSESQVRGNTVATVLRGVLAAIPSMMLDVILAERDAVGLESRVRGNAVATLLRGVLAAIPSVMLVVILAAPVHQEQALPPA